MDIILTGIASILLIVGFFVICRTSEEDEEEEEEYENQSNENEEEATDQNPEN